MTSSLLIRRRRRPVSGPLAHDVSVRLAGEHDRRELDRPAALDSSDGLTGRVLIGRVNGELRAAVSLDDGRAIADPFAATRELVGALRRIACAS